MSIDFDSVALQTQQEEEEEEEYDPEDFAREQELHRLLTDLPDDMLEDSREGSSPEPEYHPCSDRSDDHRPPNCWEQQKDWPNQQGGPTAEDNYENDYGGEEYPYEDGEGHFDGRGHPHPHAGQEYANGGYAYPSLGTDESAIGKDFSTEEGYQYEPYPAQSGHPGEGFQHEPYPAQSGHPGEGSHRPEGDSEEQDYGDQTSTRQTFKNLEGEGPVENVLDRYQARYNPHQPRMFSSEVPCQDGRFEQLQRQFLDAGQNSTDHQQVAQLQILNQAQNRQREELEQRLEDGKRKIRYLEHQFNIVKDEKEGLAVSLREAGRLMEDAKEREIQLQGKVTALELQVQALNDREHENVKKQRVAEAAVDSVKQQMAELCRSDTLSRAREQHDRDLSALREQHQSHTLALQTNLDSLSQSLEEQTELCQRLREQLQKVEREREEEKLQRAGIINTLTQRLEESQQQCANLLQTGTAQELSHLRTQLQQAQSLKSINDNMNQSLQEELSELKEQISLYESGVKFGLISLDTNGGEWENQLSDSYVELGIKRTNWKNRKFHSSPLAAVGTDGSLSRDEMVVELKSELQRFLESLKGKRKKIGHLQEELNKAQSHAQDLRGQLERAERSVRDAKVRETSLEKHLESSAIAASPQDEQVKQHLQERVQALERQREELRRSEEKLKADNLQLCTKMREMIQEFDQEKQQAAERIERTQQQYRDDVVKRVHEELSREHAARMEELSAEAQLKIGLLEAQLAEASKEMSEVQECYVTLCKEKDQLEENLRHTMEEERKSREEELKAQLGDEKHRALEEQRVGLEEQNRAALEELREQNAQVLQQVQSQLARAKTAWQGEHNKAMQGALERVEKEWARRVEEAQGRGRMGSGGGAEDQASQTDSPDWLEARLGREAEVARAQAVEEALKRAKQELQDKHLADVAQQVESAVSRVRSCWLQEMTSLPEYKARLQMERQEWERQQEEAVAKQVSVALGEAEQSWLQTHQRKLEELEAESARQRAELREEVESLRRQLEWRREEEAASLKAELARAHASWGRDRQEEMSRVRAQNERDYRSFLEEQRGALEQARVREREEAERRAAETLAHKEAEFQRLLRARREEWDCERERQGREEREGHHEEALGEVRAALDQLHTLLTASDERPGEERETRCSGSPPQGALWVCVQAGCRDLISEAVAQAKQEWKKSAQGKLGRGSKETQDQRESDACQSSMSQPCSPSCVERVGRLQKQTQELQRHLEKACRQLQHTVRENKASTQRLREEQEAAIGEAQRESQRRLEEARRSGGESCSSVAQGSSQQCLQAGLEEMKEQYMRAVQKIRGDMLRYLQESKERAALLIGQEVLRERRDTARRMRRYYLSCLQELLQEAGTSQGAEKKILSAASKLAAMTKALETPLSKRREGKSASKAKAAPTEDQTRRALTPPPGARRPRGRGLADRKESESDRTSPGTGASKIDAIATPHGVLSTGEVPCHDSLKLSKRTTPPQEPHFLSRELGGGASRFSIGDVTAANVTVRTQSRELFLSDGRPGQTGASSEPLLIQEAPVRDEGSQSDWSGVSVGLGHFDLLFPKPFPLSDTDEDGHLTSFRTTAWPDASGHREVPKASEGRRDPTPGSEGERIRRVGAKSLLSELRACQQDSGFDSPLSLLHK
ncbi:hypothetical protein AAFF_G00067970 [Aldrovandia affinis]|uniref:CEP152 CEP63 binding coiled coil domain-containing protein n=1 Tax=Aldrovandia affinis TaxID=143900 RepID=A0AAD7RZB6_9TELE|nr:hypothetical protein AAFF_G00067970 [Aldrovandia affinis]